MKKFERFCRKYEKYGVKNLMTIIVAGQGILGLLSIFLSLTNQIAAQTMINSLSFIPEAFLGGEVWRLVTFLFVPENLGNLHYGLNLLWFAFSLFFYYWIGRSLQAVWGRMKLTIYYLSGMLIAVAFSLLTGAIASLFYLNLSLFFALATLMPNERIRLYMLIPIKMKYVALAQAALFIVLPFLLSWPPSWGNLFPILSILNYLIFFARDLWKLVRRAPRSMKASRRTIQFKSEVKRAKSNRGYIHKCAACGRTDADLPDMEFRYCSLCAGYACYCADHIFDHVHKLLQ